MHYFKRFFFPELIDRLYCTMSGLTMIILTILVGTGFTLCYVLALVFEIVVPGNRITKWWIEKTASLVVSAASDLDS